MRLADRALFASLLGSGWLLGGSNCLGFSSFGSHTCIIINFTHNLRLVSHTFSPTCLSAASSELECTLRARHVRTLKSPVRPSPRHEILACLTVRVCGFCYSRSSEVWRISSIQIPALDVDIWIWPVVFRFSFHYPSDPAHLSRPCSAQRSDVPCGLSRLAYVAIGSGWSLSLLVFPAKTVTLQSGTPRALAVKHT